MLPTIFGGIVVALGIWCQFGSYARAVIVTFGLVVFGAASAVDLPALGGASITPANFFLVFFVGRLISMPGGLRAIVAEIAPRRPLFILLMLVGWILMTAPLLPRLFDNATYVFSLSRSSDSGGDMSLLHPTSGNFSQAIYAVGGLLAAAVTAAFMRKGGGFAVVVSGLVLATTVHLVCAVLDLVTSATHTGFILDAIHTGGYAFLTEDELGGLKRISGSFSEASAFATFSLTLLAVNFSLFVSGVRPWCTGISSLLLTGFIVLATSSAGYVGLAAFYGLFVCYAVVVAACFGRQRALAIAVCAGLAVVFFCGLAFLLFPGAGNIVQTVIVDSLVTKSTSISAIERGSWNTQAWQVFLDTYGAGAGIGATRGSNYALVLLSNLGFVGFILFTLLLLRLTAGRLAPSLSDQDAAIVWAVRIGMLATLIPSLLAGTVYDLGTLFYCLVGIASAGATGKSAMLARETLRPRVAHRGTNRRRASASDLTGEPLTFARLRT